MQFSTFKTFCLAEDRSLNVIEPVVRLLSVIQPSLQLIIRSGNFYFYTNKGFSIDKQLIASSVSFLNLKILILEYVFSKP